MNVRISGRRLAGAPWGLLGAALLAAAVESAAAGRSAALMTRAEFDWNAGAADASGRAARGADVLLFGDSMVKFGVQPNLLSERLGRPAYSLALLNGRPPASYFLLRRALDAGARPKLVLVDFQPECMFEGDGHMLEKTQWRAMAHPRECWDLLLAYRDPDFFARTLLAYASPTFRLRDGLREALAAALRGSPPANAAENAKAARNRVANRGGMLLPKVPGYRGEIPDKVRRVLTDPGWFGRPSHAAYVDRFLGLAASRGIPVAWILPPNVPEVDRERQRLGIAARYDRFLGDFQRRYPGLRVLDARRSGFDLSDFTDAVHLDRDGATALTLAVAEAVRPTLDAPTPKRPSLRWVALTPSRDPAPRLALEDLDQSGAKVQRR